MTSSVEWPPPHYQYVEYPEAGLKRVADFVSQGCIGKKCEVGEPVMIFTQNSLKVKPWKRLSGSMLVQSLSLLPGDTWGERRAVLSISKRQMGIRR